MSCKTQVNEGGRFVVGFYRHILLMKGQREW